MVQTTELRLNLPRVDIGCPSCGQFFYFEMKQGTQKCPRCGFDIKKAEIVKAIQAFLVNL